MTTEQPTIIKRYEFTDGKTDPFTVFEGHESEPFWNRADLGPCFVFTDLTYAAALQFEARGVVTKTVHDSSEAEYEEFKRRAQETHKAFGRGEIA